MKDMFSLFAELHQTEELGPVLAIIPACTEAETMVHMMNKQHSRLPILLPQGCIPSSEVHHGPSPSNM
jgi:hypothetical protein